MFFYILDPNWWNSTCDPQFVLCKHFDILILWPYDLKHSQPYSDAFLYCFLVLWQAMWTLPSSSRPWLESIKRFLLLVAWRKLHCDCASLTYSLWSNMLGTLIQALGFVGSWPISCFWVCCLPEELLVNKFQRLTVTGFSGNWRATKAIRRLVDTEGLNTG